MDTQKVCEKEVVDLVNTERDMVTIGNKRIPRSKWKQLNHRGVDHDNRRLVEHRKFNCVCEVCFREINKLPPESPIREVLMKRKLKHEEREIKRIKRKAKKEVKEGKQASIRNFFRY